MVNNSEFIIHKVGYKRESRHDYDIYKKDHHVIPNQVVNVFDLGYLGVVKDFPQQLSSMPYKKKRNLELSQKEMESNKNHSKKRIVIEQISCIITHKQFYDQQISINLFSLCFHARGYPENHCFSNHLQALQYRNLMISMIKRYQINIPNMKYTGYPNEEKIEKET